MRHILSTFLEKRLNYLPYKPRGSDPPQLNLSNKPQHVKTNKMTCAQRRPWSAWASAHSDQSSLGTLWLANASSGGQPRFWSDWADAQADMSLHWAHRSFVSFVVPGSNIFSKPAFSVTQLLNAIFGLVWFLFYCPSTHFRSFRARSVTLTILFLGKPPRQFTSI